MTINDLCHNVSQLFRDHDIPEPETEAIILIGHYLGLTRSQIFLSAEDLPTKQQIHSVNDAAHKRTTRLPLAYIIEEQEFYSRPFKVSPDVLIPRQETELLIEHVIRIVNSGVRQRNSINILDLGTGSGIVAITLALELPHAKVVTIDHSFKALKIAQKNVANFGVGSRVELLNSDWLTALRDNCKFDCIVSNPPYVAEEAMNSLQPELSYEPVFALTSGPNGTRDLEKITKGAGHCLNVNGWLVLEIGFDQGNYIFEQMTSLGNYDSIIVHNDYAGHPRVMQARYLGDNL